MRIGRKATTDAALKLRRPDYSEQRGDQWLLIWSGIPHWTVVDDDLHDLLRELDGHRSLEDILSAHLEWVTSHADIVSAMSALEKAGVVSSEANRRAVAQEPQPPRIENVALNITRRCNLRCKFCYNQGFPEPDAAEELPADEICRFLKSLKPLLAKKPSLTVLGGEPFLRAEDLTQVCAQARRYGFSTLVSTNGTLVTDGFARQARMIGLQVQVSLDGHSAELHESVRGTETFEKTCEGISKLVGHRVHTIVSMVCHEGNLQHLEAFYDLALELGVNEARFIPLKRIGGGAGGGFSPASMLEIMRVGSELFMRRPELLRLAGRDAFSIVASTCSYSIAKKSCGTGLQTFLLDSDGSIYPCLNTNLPEFRLGNIREPGFDFASLWNQASILGNYRKQTAVSEEGGACSDCVVRHWCVGGCRGETYVTTGSIDGKAPGCEDLRETIIEMMWMIAGRPDLIRRTATAC